MTAKTYEHGRPIDLEFYRRLRRGLGDRKLAGPPRTVPGDGGLVVRAPAGSLISFEVVAAPQIVNVFFWHSADPDERYWAEETMLIEGAYLQRYVRLWSTMARFRPMATVVEDTVVTMRRLGEPQAFHHFAHGGSGTPADWAARGGRPGVASTWQRMAALLRGEGLPPHHFTQNLSLFQKTAIDPLSQVITLLPSDALPGDRHVWFAEIDLTLAVVASPYRGGGEPMTELDGTAHPVELRVQPGVARPLAWPYPGVRYPDLSLYLDPATGTRSRAVGPTPGIGRPA